MNFPIRLQQVFLGLLFSNLARPSLAEFRKLLNMISNGCGFDQIELWSSYPELQQWHSRWFLDFPKAIEKLALHQEQGIQFCFPFDPLYPSQYLLLEDPPFFLSFKGLPLWLDKLGFAVVGTREPSGQSEIWCERELRKTIAAADYYVISGGARGIDQIAHRLALREARATVAFLPSGLNSVYPPGFNDWLSPIINKGGAVVSEFAPDAPMKKLHFQRRNRLIAGLAFATLIIEARRRSGTMLTAKQAADQHKPLFVIPSHPLDTNNLGALDLLFEGATPVRDAVDLLTLLSSEAMHQKFSLGAASGGVAVE